MHFKSSVLIIMLFYFSASENIFPNKLPLWTWKCINDKCVPEKATKAKKLQSLATCNMLCSTLHFWPLPTGIISLPVTAVPVSAELFRLKIISSPSNAVSTYLRKAFKLFKGDMRMNGNNSHDKNDLRSVFVRIAVNESGSEDPRMRLDTDEAYNLWLRPENGSKRSLIVDIASNSFCGARHALETLSQLVWHDTYTESLLIMEAATVDDAPRFSYRGLMIDTAHNYFPVSELIRTLDAMAACKLNTFHWHATNLHAFPLLFNSLLPFAQFVVRGHGVVYDVEDMRSVAKHARIRGIRVILEVNLPAFIINPWTGSQSDTHELAYCTHPLPIIAYDLLEKLYSEIIHITEVDDVFHLGNNDVFEHCLQKPSNLSDPVNYWLEFTNNALQRLSTVNGGVLPNLTILWSSHLTQHLNIQKYLSKIGIQIRNVSWAQNYARGIRTILSHHDVWDLNSGYGTWPEYFSGLPYNSWQRVYEHRARSRKSIGNMLGGEATVWSSTLSAGELDSHFWPRAAALAERLWSDRAEGSTRSVYARLDVHRARLVFRRIHAAPLWSMWCTHNTFTC